MNPLPVREVALRVLATGAASHLGSVLCAHLLAAGHRAVALDAVHHGVPSLLHLCANPGFEFVRGDARDEAVFARPLKNADAVIPRAAVVGAPGCDRDPWLATSSHVDAIRLLPWLRSASQPMVYPTTKRGDVFCTEATPLEPISP